MAEVIPRQRAAFSAIPALPNLAVFPILLRFDGAGQATGMANAIIDLNGFFE